MTSSIAIPRQRAGGAHGRPLRSRVRLRHGSMPEDRPGEAAVEPVTVWLRAASHRDRAGGPHVRAHHDAPPVTDAGAGLIFHA